MRQRSRDLFKCFLFGFMVFFSWKQFSPWKIVIQPRPVAGNPKGHGDETPIGANGSDQNQTSHRKDVIEKEYGDLENDFLKSAQAQSSPPRRSRDESIKLIYNAKDKEDWLDLIDGHDSHGLMALTKVTQQYIYNKQNPTQCEGQRFLILNHFPGDLYGIGALFQHISDYLSIAIQTNSILLYAEDQPPGQNFVQSPADGGDESCGRSLDCILLPVSKCKSPDQKGVNEKSRSVFSGSEIDLDVPSYLQKRRKAIPPVFEDALKVIQPDISEEMLKYWWRAQAAGYLMRLNGKTASRMKELRLGQGVAQRGIQWDKNGEPQNTTTPFPMPEGTISIHVRHGDKGAEMRLVPFNDYVVKTEKFAALNPFGFWKRGFLSTEDPNVIEQMKSMARVTPFEMSSSNARWTWYWSDIPRLNSGPEQQLSEFGNRTEMTIKWLLQLVMAIECDAFVGTRGSGWNRLIDSLRCIWLASCKQPFLEVGFENDWTGYGPQI